MHEVEPSPTELVNMLLKSEGPERFFAYSRRGNHVEYGQLTTQDLYTLVFELSTVPSSIKIARAQRLYRTMQVPAMVSLGHMGLTKDVRGLAEAILVRDEAERFNLLTQLQDINPDARAKLSEALLDYDENLKSANEQPSARAKAQFENVPDELVDRLFSGIERKWEIRLD